MMTVKQDRFEEMGPQSHQARHGFTGTAYGVLITADCERKTRSDN